MAKYVSKPIDAYTLKECIAIGKKIEDAVIIDGVVMSFKWNGILFSHETDTHYIISGGGLIFNFTSDLMLVVYEVGVFELIPMQSFNYNYIKEDAILDSGKCSQ